MYFVSMTVYMYFSFIDDCSRISAAVLQLGLRASALGSVVLILAPAIHRKTGHDYM